MTGAAQSSAAPARPTQTNSAPQVLAAPARPSIDGFSQDELVEILVKVAPRRWIEREELFHLAVAKLGFARLGANIRARLKSACTGAIRRGLFEYQDTRVRRKAGSE